MTPDAGCRRAILTVGVAAAILGLAATAVAWGAGFSASRSRAFGWPQHELALLRFNVAGGLTTAALGALAAAGARVGRRIPVNVAAAGFALVALQAAVQAGSSTNWLGATGSNLGLAVGLAAGLAAVSQAWSVVGRMPEAGAPGAGAGA